MRGTKLIIPGMLVVGLAGCVSPAYPALDRPATEQDELPRDFDTIDLDDLGDIDPQSSRHVGSYEDLDFYIMTGADDQICLAVAAGARSMLSCSTRGAGISVGVPRLYDVQLVPEPARDGEGYIAISDNIRVNPRP